MAAYGNYLVVFICSFIGLGIFYRNTLRNRAISLYLFFYAFTTYSFLCNLYFGLPQGQHFVAFYTAQSVFVFSYLLKKGRKKQTEPVYKKQQGKAPVSLRTEETKEYAVQ
jgi:uncharacterized membrane protein